MLRCMPVTISTFIQTHVKQSSIKTFHLKPYALSHYLSPASLKLLCFLYKYNVYQYLDTGHLEWYLGSGGSALSVEHHDCLSVTLVRRQRHHVLSVTRDHRLLERHPRQILQRVVEGEQLSPIFENTISALHIPHIPCVHKMFNNRYVTLQRIWYCLLINLLSKYEPATFTVMRQRQHVVHFVPCVEGATHGTINGAGHTGCLSQPVGPPPFYFILILH